MLGRKAEETAHILDPHHVGVHQNGIVAKDFPRDDRIEFPDFAKYDGMLSATGFSFCMFFETSGISVGLFRYSERPIWYADAFAYAVLAKSDPATAPAP